MALPDSISELTKDIADKLNEMNSGALKQIQSVTEVAGEEFARSLLEETYEIEEKGGMMVESEGEMRRRSPGGVFFYLVKERLSEEQRKIVFPSLPRKKKAIPIVIEPEAQLFAHQAANKLKEVDPDRKEYFAKIAQLGGSDLVKEALDIVIDMENQDGLRRPDGTRRSPGEAFLYIASRRLTNEDRQRIWPILPEELRPPKKKSPVTTRQTAKKPRKTPIPVGAATTAKITLIGRPSELFHGPGYVAFTLKSFRVPNLPRGLPAPVENTSYRVYILEKNWERVAEEAQEGLIIEGYPAFDPEDGIAVYAVSLKTRSNRPDRPGGGLYAR